MEYTATEQIFISELKQLSIEKENTKEIEKMTIDKKIYSFIDRVINTYTNPNFSNQISIKGLCLIISTATFLLE